jgi:hypothetical protein
VRRIRDYDEDYVSERVGGMTPLGLFMRALGVVVVIVLIFGVTGFVLGWFNAGKDVVSPTNVKAQWQFAYDNDSALDAIALQYCTAQKAETTETDPSAKVQRTDQRIAIENNYARVAADYDGRLRDAFRARLVRPRDVPTRAPTLAENVADNCDAP